MPLSRRLLISGVSGLVLAGSRQVAAQDANLPPLDARLGGTIESFQAQFGLPEPRTNSSSHDFYELPNTSGAFVTVVSGRVVELHIFAPRGDGEEWEDKPNSMNWTFFQAQQITLDFLPRDVVLFSDLDEAPYGFLQKWYSSEALAAEVPTTVYEEVDDTPQYGKGSAILWYADFNQGPEFSRVVVQLEIEEPPI